ncbi:MAG: glycoside hydrolase family 65 protein [Bacteroidales bacterium]|nr:glycoside hydrolase family 65 protein [Bacteroidales bacterium]MCF8406212.1 glycoside hydrolase family 65 protein [Bacteroidales bacterium]
MNNRYYKVDEWKVIEEGFNPEMQEASESLFSLGNGRMGQRANFEEAYSGKTFQGNYIAGVYYPDKTRVGWWKNGYPEYFAKVLNAPNWIGINIEIDGESLDLAKCKLKDFTRELNMKQGFLLRKFTAILSGGKEIKVVAKRFLSIANDEMGAIHYSISSVNFSGNLSFTPYLDGDVKNKDSNYNEIFWDILNLKAENGYACLHSKTKKSGFEVCLSMNYSIEKNGSPTEFSSEIIQSDKLVGNKINLQISENDTVSIKKYVSVLNSMNHSTKKLIQNGKSIVEEAKERGFNNLFEDHASLWDTKWAHSDIIIKGDDAAQQGIRFNIFHLNQTYTGQDERLNIGPKGFTGEKYGGSTYWDTEAFLIPFYLSTAPQEVSRNLLIYRHKHLQKAIENGKKLGFHSGAALYPMVTMNGEECHNEWEITFEEIHRNGAIAFAIFNYIRYTNDKAYLAEYGLEVLIAISRFWRQRVNWSDVKGKYVMLGVTGPNEYENNVNNNWYSNKMAVWTLEYSMDALNYVMDEHPADYARIVDETKFNYEKEIKEWKDIVESMYFPYSDNLKVFLQQDGYLDKDQMKVSELKESDKPLNQNWSWDRILRSPFIKQADVLQGIYTFEEEFDLETIKRNYDYYEPRTVHESSLSPCIHSILASKIGYKDQSYNFYLRTSRLDIDDYNHEVDEGLHITSMGGTWMSVVYGFGGLRIVDHFLHLNPSVPEKWESLSFRIVFRENTLKIKILNSSVEVINESGPDMLFLIRGKEYRVNKGEVEMYSLGVAQGR